MMTVSPAVFRKALEQVNSLSLMGVDLEPSGAANYSPGLSSEDLEGLEWALLVFGESVSVEGVEVTDLYGLVALAAAMTGRGALPEDLILEAYLRGAWDGSLELTTDKIVEVASKNLREQFGATEFSALEREAEAMVAKDVGGRRLERFTKLRVMLRQGVTSGIVVAACCHALERKADAEAAEAILHLAWAGTPLLGVQMDGRPLILGIG